MWNTTDIGDYRKHMGGVDNMNRECNTIHTFTNAKVNESLISPLY